MGQNAPLKIKEREFILVGLFLMLTAAIAALFPNIASPNANGVIDWISIPLVGFPILSSIVLLAFASQEKASRMTKLDSPVRLACLAFSLVPLGISTALFFDWLAVIDWTNTVTIPMLLSINTSGLTVLVFPGTLVWMDSHSRWFG